MRARKGGRIEAAAHVLALEEGWADADTRPMPVLEESWVDAGDTSPPDGSMPLRNAHPHEYHSEVGDLLEAVNKTLALALPKAAKYDKSFKRNRGGGLATAAHHKKLSDQWERDLRAYYKAPPLTRHTSYRAEAGRLLHSDRRVKWSDSPPKETYLRKKILPPLLRKLFPHLYS